MPKKTLTQILADRLNELIPASNLSDSAFAKRAGVAGNTISNYRTAAYEFTSKGKPRSAELGNVERIAAALGVHPLELLRPKEDGQTARPAESPQWDFHSVDIRRWERLSERQKGIVEDAMNQALDRVEASVVQPANSRRA